MPHPSKLPASWMYPMQMVSIPSTEEAEEKGWEPGINKYTLYQIHVRILLFVIMNKFFFISKFCCYDKVNT